MAKITKSDYKFFEMARKEAEKSDFEGFKLGCVLVYRKHVIGRGHNSNKTSPKQKKYNRHRQFKKGPQAIKHSLHAEIDAINAVTYPVASSVNWSDVKVYVFRISPGKPLGQGLSAPCPACRAALSELGVRHLYYTGDTSYIYEEMF